MMLVFDRTTSVYTMCNFVYIGINLTAESNKGQLDAYVQNAEWALEG
jgi:hypothetical protein